MATAKNIQFSVLATGCDRMVEQLRELVQITRQAAEAIERLFVMLPGRWPDYFSLLSRRLRYGFQEQPFGKDNV